MLPCLLSCLSHQPACRACLPQCLLPARPAQHSCLPARPPTPCFRVDSEAWHAPLLQLGSHPSFGRTSRALLPAAGRRRRRRRPAVAWPWPSHLPACRTLRSTFSVDFATCRVLNMSTAQSRRVCNPAVARSELQKCAAQPRSAPAPRLTWRPQRKSHHRPRCARAAAARPSKAPAVYETSSRDPAHCGSPSPTRSRPARRLRLPRPR